MLCHPTKGDATRAHMIRVGVGSNVGPLSAVLLCFTHVSCPWLLLLAPQALTSWWVPSILEFFLHRALCFGIVPLIRVSLLICSSHSVASHRFKFPDLLNFFWVQFCRCVCWKWRQGRRRRRRRLQWWPKHNSQRRIGARKGSFSGSQLHVLYLFFAFKKPTLKKFQNKVEKSRHDGTCCNCLSESHQICMWLWHNLYCIFHNLCQDASKKISD